MSQTATASQGLTASVRVENEEPITISVELTDQIRASSIEKTGEALREALLVVESGVDNQEDALALAAAAKRAHRYAEVVYTLTLGPEEDAT